MAHSASQTRPITSFSFHPLQWLLRHDAAYREAQELKRTEDHHLADMGITRDEADTAFYSRFGQHRWYSK